MPHCSVWGKSWRELHSATYGVMYINSMKVRAPRVVVDCQVLRKGVNSSITSECCGDRMVTWAPDQKVR